MSTNDHGATGTSGPGAASGIEPGDGSLRAPTLTNDGLDEEIRTLETEGYHAPRWQRGLAWLRELQQLRAAKTADRERVETVVMSLASAVLEHPETKVLRAFDVAAAIACHVADALAVPAQPVLSEQQKADISNAITDLENGSRGRRPYDLTVRDVLLRLLSGAP